AAEWSSLLPIIEGRWVPAEGGGVQAVGASSDRRSHGKGNPEGRRAGSSELPNNYEAIHIGAAAHADTTAAGDANGVTAMKRLCGSVSRAAGKPPRRSTTERAWDLLEGDAVVVPITLAAMPRCNHSHRETTKSVWICAESTATVIANGGHRGTVRHVSAHTEQQPQTAEQKQRERKMTPRAGNTFTHGGHRAAASAVIQHNAKRRPTHASIR
ncbi:hypothetical protein MOQ_005439, partial [Trypanosoma cruzi marinkellei]